jgi:hypothetical protein
MEDRAEQPVWCRRSGISLAPRESNLIWAAGQRQELLLFLHNCGNSAVAGNEDVSVQRRKATTFAKNPCVRPEVAQSCP